jgi:hypothetical protein
MKSVEKSVYRDKVRAAWSARADVLASWASSRLINRRDVWGGYWTEQTADGPVTRATTRPHPRDRGRVYVGTQLLANHFAAVYTRSVVGLHSTSIENTSLWGAVDVDWHIESSTAPNVNLAAAIHWYGRLKVLGFRPLLTDSNGKGGFHLRALFREPVPTAKVYRFLCWLVRDHAKHGLPTPPETFPKQSQIKPGGYGNWLRLPGRHHTREHWSRGWNGSDWLDDYAAIDFILALDGDDPQLIPSEAQAPKVTLIIRRASNRRIVRSQVDALSSRIRSYLAKLPIGLGEGMRRDDYGFIFAAFLVRDLGLSDAEALPWLEEWDRRNAVAKGPDCLRKLLASARAYGRHAYRTALARGGSR